MERTLKDYCRDARKRLKSGFWEEYRRKLKAKLEEANKSGMSESHVKEYFAVIAQQEIKSVSQEEEAFYQKVKKMLIEEGEVSNAIGRLTDNEVYHSLSYDDRQRYIMNVSERYLKAVERFRRESAMEDKHE